ncbi:unnamed protein product, partial [marine sediment metagenome]
TLAASGPLLRTISPAADAAELTLKLENAAFKTFEVSACLGLEGADDCMQLPAHCPNCRL